MQEDAERAGDSVTFRAAPSLGNHVRRRGEDLASGAVALTRGTRLNPFRLGLAAAHRLRRRCASPSGHAWRCCARATSCATPARPSRRAPFRIRTGPAWQRWRDARAPWYGDCHARATTWSRRAARSARRLATAIVADRGRRQRRRPRRGQGGARSRRRDFDFWKVKIKPGKPLAFGRRDGAFVLGLPGNPVSAQLTLSLFGLPLLRALQGDAKRCRAPSRCAWPVPFRKSRAGSAFTARACSTVSPTCTTIKLQERRTSMAKADVLVMVPEDSSGLPAGGTAQALRLDDL